MTPLPTILTGLREIAGDYDALVCDVWGVVHDGERPHPGAVEALRRFRTDHGRVVLLSNAPRPAAAVERQLTAIGVPAACYDAVVTSGAAAREDIARRAANGPLAMMHLGPDRDSALYEGLNVALVGPDKASVVLLTGLYDDETETPEHYREILAELKSRGLTLICANPDLIVPRGGRLVHCAGGLARAYEAIGGDVVYYGKPHPAIFKAALAAAGSPSRPLVVGDGLETDIRGANRLGADALFVVHGVHAEELGALTADNLAALFAKKCVTARAAMGALAW
ncbi:MAG: TIGR01459 family HAD-type hydrolase [Alphaproteobacteria bacterium]|nr:TIGR01459 family HAD-type hydrolase [Alphaproteobacteria bacterium]MDE2629769.1 TIGR01459 family HAD-type hydrolase [Alphaproteobacteria bacterium]